MTDQTRRTFLKQAALGTAAAPVAMAFAILDTGGSGGEGGAGILIIDDLGMRKLPMTAAEDLLEIVMRRYERASTLLTSNRPVDDFFKSLAAEQRERAVAAGAVLLSRLGAGPRSTVAAPAVETRITPPGPLT